MNSMINDLHNIPEKYPDLVASSDIQRLTYFTKTGGKVDERPVIEDYETGSLGRITRIMKWADDYIPGHESRKGCCLRFEVTITKPGRSSTHHEGDYVIWSQTFNDVMRNATIKAVMRQYGITDRELRATLIRDGFEELAKTF